MSRAFRGNGTVSLEIDTNAELTDVLDKVKLRIDGIATFPAGMEPVNVSQVEFQQDVIEMPLVGNLPLSELKQIAKEVEDELLQLGTVSLVQMSAPNDEIAIEIKPDTLRKYGLSIADVTRSINNYSANISAGQIRTNAGLVSVRVENQFYSGEEFANIPVKIGQGGAKVTLGDVAFINDGFVEGERYFKYNGMNAIAMAVKATKTQDTIPVAETVKAYIETKK